MSNVSIGITAMELFAYNPFRILGLPVNASHAEISGTYEMLLKMADSGDIGGYTTPFDFDSLPPFSRSGQTIKTAHAKLASNGYRCFAYADSVFSTSLNIDDIMLNLRGITCYDCFLRCYMWLIINDRNMEEHELWILLAKYIDKMIVSSPEEWTRYFDHRFPEEMIDENLSVYKSFYSTFCEIILLPLKEMVRGSMKCSTAIDILKCAKIDVNEQFEYIDIPQANVPRAGEPEPKLKIALKYGDEYFDASTGSMKSYDSGTAASEDNSFAATNAAPLDASVLMDDEPEETAEETPDFFEDDNFGFDDLPVSAVQPEPEPEPAPAPRPAPRPAPIPAPDPEPQRTSGFSGRSRAERRAEKEAAEAAAAPKLDKKPIKTELVAPVAEPLKLDNENAQAAPVVPARPATKPQQPSAPRQRRSFNRADAADTTAASTSSGEFVNPFGRQEKRPDPTTLSDKAGSAVRKNSFNAVVEEAARKEAEAAAAMYAEEEEEDGDIRNALIDLLKSSSGRGETMKSVDTSHIVSAKEMAGPSHTTANMDAIDMKEYDAKRLASTANAERRMTREEKYRNIKIDDMLSGQAQGKNYGITAIDQYKKNKEEQKKARKSLFIAMGFVALVILVFVAFFFFGFI